MQYFFNLEAQPLGLVVDYSRKLLEHLSALCHRRVCQHLCSKRYCGYWCFELVCHVVDEIVFHLGVFSLAEHEYHCEYVCCQQYYRQYECRYDEPHAAEYVFSHVGEVQLDDSHVFGRVVGEEYPCKGVFGPFGVVIGATVELAAFAREDLEVVWQFYAVAFEFVFKSAVENAEVHALVYWFFARFGKQEEYHVVEFPLLVYITLLYYVLHFLGRTYRGYGALMGYVL